MHVIAHFQGYQRFNIESSYFIRNACLHLMSIELVGQSNHEKEYRCFSLHVVIAHFQGYQRFNIELSYFIRNARLH